MDDAAFEAFFRAHFIPACRFAAGMVGSGAAEDAAQEAFFRLLTRWRRLRDPARPEPYFYRILSSHCLNVLRRRRLWRRISHLFRPAPFIPHQEPDDPKRMLDLLSPKERAMFMLTEVSALSDADAAVSLDIAESTLRVLRHRIRRKLSFMEEKDETRMGNL